MKNRQIFHAASFWNGKTQSERIMWKDIRISKKNARKWKTNPSIVHDLSLRH